MRERTSRQLISPIAPAPVAATIGRRNLETATIDLAIPTLLVISAIVFGPLSAWLAVARDRSALIWFAYGLLLGPIAPLLIAIAPPGRCRVCGERSRGWLDRCVACGSPLDGSTRVAVTMASGAATGPSSGSQGTPPASARSGANLAAVGAVPATAVKAAGPMPPATTAPPATAPSAARSATAESEILATGVFVGGSVHLSLGARYAIARRKRTFEVRGPVDVAPGVLRLEHPLAGLDATVVADRLVVTEKTTGRPKFVMVFQTLSVMEGIDLEAAFGNRRKPRARAAGA